MPLNIDEQDITNVSHYKLDYLQPGYVIEFKINGFRYKLHTDKQENGAIFPHHIVHIDQTTDCNYCDNDTYYCYGLMDHRNELFHRLIEFPSIRLDWLYINHV